MAAGDETADTILSARREAGASQEDERRGLEPVSDGARDVAETQLLDLSRPLITEDWLRAVGFKWEQFERQPEKQWTLWIGAALVEHGQDRRSTSFEDLGVEVAANRYGDKIQDWFCWFRSDAAGRYHRFVHLRHIVYQDELIEIIMALSGQRWNPENHIYGSMHTPEHAARLRKEMERLDIRRNQTSVKWYEAEKDDSRGRATPQHLDAAIKSGLAK